MRYSRLVNAWTAPDDHASDDFHHLSYALFRTDSAFGTVIASRLPDGPVLGIGDIIQSKLAIPDDVMAYLLSGPSGRAPIFLLSSAGLGLISMRYDREAVLGLYLHIHCRPEAGARLINSGALGRENGVHFVCSQGVRAAGDRVRPADMRSYGALLDAWQTVESWCPERDWPVPADSFDLSAPVRCPTIGRLQDMAGKLAAFVGVDLTMEDTDFVRFGRRVFCYRPALLEAVLLYCFSEILHYAVPGTATLSLIDPDVKTTAGVCERLHMRLGYSVDGSCLSVPTRTCLRSSRVLLTFVGRAAGLDVRWEGRLPLDGAAGVQTVSLTWTVDPATLPETDLRAGMTLREEDEEDED